MTATNPPTTPTHSHQQAGDTTMTAINPQRLIITEGDGEPVYRRARKFNAIVEVFRTGDPGIRLTVRPDGAWSLVSLPTGRGPRQPEMPVTAGVIGQPQPEPGDVIAALYRHVDDHTTGWLDELMVKAGLMWRCANTERREFGCGYMNCSDETTCGDCGASRDAAPL